MKDNGNKVYNLLWRGFRKEEITKMVKSDPGYYGFIDDDDLTRTIDACGRMIFSNWED